MLTGEQVKTLRAHPDVGWVSKEFVGLRNGEIVRPEDFIVLSRKLYLVMRLVRCGCGRHAEGTLLLIDAVEKCTVFGPKFLAAHKDVAFCPGEWEIAEAMTEGEAVEAGLEKPAFSREGKRPERKLLLDDTVSFDKETA